MNELEMMNAELMNASSGIYYLPSFMLLFASYAQHSQPSPFGLRPDKGAQRSQKN